MSSSEPDGTVVRTMWGELAYQLGGAEGYALVAEADRTGTSPGEALTDLLRSCAPCLILIDEWVGYARQLYGIPDLPAGSFDAHFSFAQALTDAAAATAGALLVATIPSSQIEVGGEGGQAALTRLEHLFARTQANWRTATAEESFEIVRRRLFEEVSPEAARQRDAVLGAFAKLYQRQRADFPMECREGDYLRRMRATYPIHPELFDRLFGEWSELERFQRTRGVLRFMASVIHALWIGSDPNLLIMPGTIPVDDHEVCEELLRYINPAWRTVVEKDVEGTEALPLRLDKSNPNFGRSWAARKVARTVYFGSAPSQHAANRGLDERSVKLGCTQPDDRPSTYQDALRRLSDRATYLYRDSTRYWYSISPTVNRMARDRAENNFDDTQVDDEIRTRVEEQLRIDRGGFAGVHPCARRPADVPDLDEVRLVVLDPTAPHDTKIAVSAAEGLARRILDERSGGTRQHRNMLAFLAADTARLGDLRQAAREYLAWQSIQQDINTLELDEFQKKQVVGKLQDVDEATDARIGETYIWAMYPSQPPDDPTGEIRWSKARLTSPVPLAERVYRKLCQDEEIINDYAGSLLRGLLDNVPLWRENPDRGGNGTSSGEGRADGGDGETGGDERLEVSVRQLWDDFTRYLYLPRLRNRSVLENAVKQGVADTAWRADGFAYAEGHSSDRYIGLRAGEQLSSVSLSGLLVHPTAAIRQLAREAPAMPLSTGSPPSTRPASTGLGTAPPGTARPRPVERLTPSPRPARPRPERPTPPPRPERPRPPGPVLSHRACSKHPIRTTTTAG